MAKTRKQKEELLAKYENFIKQANAIYFVNANLSANDTNAFRKKLNNVNSKYHLLKNSLINLAIKKVLEKDYEFKGKVSGVVVFGDVVESAKLLEELKKEGKATYIASLFEKDIKSEEFISKLASLESRDVLLGKLMYLINYPTTGLARALANNIQKLLYALEAVKTSKS